MCLKTFSMWRVKQAATTTARRRRKREILRAEAYKNAMAMPRPWGKGKGGGVRWCQRCEGWRVGGVEGRRE